MSEEMKDQAMQNTPEEHVDDLVQKALVALDEFMKLDQEAVDYIVGKATSCFSEHRSLAKMAVDETGRGVFEDKATKKFVRL